MITVGNRHAAPGDPAKVADYHRWLLDNPELDLPPIEVHSKPNRTYRIHDGRHRFLAYVLAEREEIPVLALGDSASRGAPPAHELLTNPDAMLSSTHLRDLGLSRNQIDAVWRACGVVVLPGTRRPLVKVSDYRALVEQSTYGNKSNRIQPPFTPLPSLPSRRS